MTIHQRASKEMPPTYSNQEDQPISKEPTNYPRKEKQIYLALMSYHLNVIHSMSKVVSPFKIRTHH